jgi:hypothetical protein
MKERKHDVRCEEAKTKKCRCCCGGRQHNPKFRPDAAYGEERDSFPGAIEVWKEKRTPLDDEPTFTLRSPLPEAIRAWRDNSNGRIGSARTNVPHKYVWHSPDGFEWGYGGSGPADFALNALALFLDPGTARFLHQDFKWAFIAALPPEGGIIEPGVIVEWIQSKKAEVEALASGG